MKRAPSSMHSGDSIHLGDPTLAAIAAGDHVAEADTHLQSCPQCTERVLDLRNLISLLGEARSLPEPPVWFRTRALAAIRRRREVGPAWAGFLRVLHDSLLAPVLNTVRGPAAPGRQLLLVGPGIELDLRLSPPAEDVPGRLTGQVYLSAPERPDSPADLAVEITDEKGTSALAEPDQFGMFSLAGNFQTPLIVTIRSRNWVEEAFIPEAAI